MDSSKVITQTEWPGGPRPKIIKMEMECHADYPATTDFVNFLKEQIGQINLTLAIRGHKKLIPIYTITVEDERAEMN